MKKPLLFVGVSVITTVVYQALFFNGDNEVGIAIMYIPIILVIFGAFVLHELSKIANILNKTTPKDDKNS